MNTHSAKSPKTRPFKSYPVYKDSGIGWLGKIPAHWEVNRLENAASKIGSGKTPSGGAEVYVSEGIILLRSQNVQFTGLRLTVQKGILPSLRVHNLAQ